MSRITFADKVALNPQPDVADINKVTNNDMNMIKHAHNDINGTILWSNSNPTQEFESQNITLSSSDYDILEFYFASSISSTNTFTSKAIKGSGTTVFVMINLNEDVSQETGVRLRNISYISDTSYQIGNGLLRGGSGSSIPTIVNNFLIPIYVIGYKTGLFNV
jgi:hypothetical protein